MNNSEIGLKGRSLVIFYISLMAISSELCFSLILGVKSYCHMVYVVISFALLGYGLGSNLILLLGTTLKRVDPNALAGYTLFLISITLALAAQALPLLHIKLDMLYGMAILKSMSLMYAIVALPFVGIGFLIGFIFSSHAEESRKLYFWDLVGAGFGAFVFFPLLPSIGPVRILLLLSIGSLVLSICCLRSAIPSRRVTQAVVGGMAILELAGLWLPEPLYSVDPGVGWEHVPGTFRKNQYQETWRVWHPLGREDLHRMTDPQARRLVINSSPGSFEIPLVPLPEFSYFTNNYRSGTPVYELSQEGIGKAGSRISPFSQPMECPYVLLDKPRVMVIGAGGGRDIFMAKVHGAPQVTGAEINPAIHRAMSPGGVAYEYSGRIYTQNGVRIHNIDGRHLVRNQTSGSQDLIVLNGIDTYAALSTGAYAFAENYLYTTDAIVDYLRILSDKGILNFNRWWDGDEPRETMRLFVMVLDALRRIGVERPWEHVIVGRDQQWGIILVKRTPFAEAEQAKLFQYFQSRQVDCAFIPGLAGQAASLNVFGEYVAALQTGKEVQFIDQSKWDISVVGDDSPFFYKYYRFTLTDTYGQFHPGGGATAFYVQIVIIGQSVVFILIFIFFPLIVLKRKVISFVPRGAKLPFLVYFASLGLGFIFIEITLMQRFTLALGSPIYAVTVTLATLLASTGVGSLLSDQFRPWAGSETRMIAAISIGVIVYLIAAVFGGTWMLNLVAGAPFPLRIVMSAALLVPIGLLLGVYFPSGLIQVGLRSPEAAVWAWGINSGFTVLGSTLSIVIAQFLGFNRLLLAAAALYGIAYFAYARLYSRLKQASSSS